MKIETRKFYKVYFENIDELRKLEDIVNIDKVNRIHRIADSLVTERREEIFDMMKEELEEILNETFEYVGEVKYEDIDYDKFDIKFNFDLYTEGTSKAVSKLKLNDNCYAKKFLDEIEYFVDKIKSIISEYHMTWARVEYVEGEGIDITDWEFDEESLKKLYISNKKKISEDYEITSYEEFKERSFYDIVGLIISEDEWSDMMEEIEEAIGDFLSDLSKVYSDLINANFDEEAVVELLKECDENYICVYQEDEIKKLMSANGS